MEVCRLCLDLLHENNFSQLDEALKDVMNTVAPEVNIEISSNPVLCKQCSSSIDELHKFKTKVIENEQRIQQKCDVECGDKSSLKEILYGVNLGEIVLTEKAKERICRTCLDSIECESFTVLKPSNPDAYLDSMITMCLPELDLEISRDPVMCEKCLRYLQKLHHLKTSCLDIEEKLKNYCTNHGTNSSAQINLHSVLETFVDDKKDHPDYVSLKTEIKTEKIDNVEMNNRDFRTENDKNILLEGVKDENMEIKTEEFICESTKEEDEICAESKNLETKEPKKEKIYACAFCSAEFADRVSLKKHKKKHAGQVKTHNCDKCPSRFTIESEYYYHIKFGHGEVKRPYTCERCSLGYTTHIGLVRHIQRFHEEKKEYPHICTYCGKGFLLQCVLKQHTMTHTGEKPFKCEYCDKAFALKTGLTQHTRYHTGERPYACDQCNKSFVSASHLSQHKKYHLMWKQPFNTPKSSS